MRSQDLQVPTGDKTFLNYYDGWLQVLHGKFSDPAGDFPSRLAASPRFYEHIRCRSVGRKACNDLHRY